MMNYNSIIKNIVPSASMQAGLSYNASDYTNFAIGAPDIPPPQEITDIIQSRAAMSKHPYTSTEGSLKARTNIAEILSDDTIEIPLEHVMMCEGAKFGIYISLKTVCNRKSKVLIIEPYWLSYPNIIAELELETIVFTPLFAEKGRLIYEVDQIISAAVNNKVSAVIINNPNNPSGQIIHNESVQKIADDLLKHNIWLIIDEVYKDLTFDESIHGSFNITGENELEVFQKVYVFPEFD
jgi:aspartate/methionine/tyrosine aminotransferase